MASRSYPPNHQYAHTYIRKCAGTLVISEFGEQDLKEKVKKLYYLFMHVRDPLPAIIDRMGLRHDPYRLKLRDGTVIELRPGTGDFSGFSEIVLRGDYFSSGQVLQQGQTVIDIGANIGCFTVTAARRVGPTGRVFAVEPEESTFHQLQRNIALNGLGNVTSLQTAVGASEGEIVLHAQSIRLFNSIYTTVDGRATTGGMTQRVPLTTLSRLMQIHGIRHCNYLKLDCEGAEHDIVGSMSHETARLVDSITMEVHRVPGQNTARLQERLQALGYTRVVGAKLPCYVRGSMGGPS